jgi:hypothetical protein
VLGGATLGVIGWADDHYDSSAVARTMGLTTFAISNVVFSLATRDERRSVFSLDVLEDRTFLLCTGGSLAAIVLGNELGILPADPGHRPPRPAPVARLHRRRARDRAGGRGEAIAAPEALGRDHSVIVPRWEWRTFGEQFGAAADRLRELSPTTRRRQRRGVHRLESEATRASRFEAACWTSSGSSR